MDLIDMPTPVLILIVVMIIAVMVLGGVHFSAIGQVEEYYALRDLVENLGTDARGEDILGQVAEFNRGIKSARAYNQIPVVQFWISDKIANLELIKIPK